MSNYSVDVTIKEVIRGEEAVKKLGIEGVYEYYFEDDEEALLVKGHVKVVDSKDDKKVAVNRSYFKMFSEGNVEYINIHRIAHLVSEQEFGETSLYQGAEHEGYLLLKVKKSDANPKLVYGSRGDGIGGVWFKLN
ncbi:hypothetical protein [Clostridium sp. Cult1]|uniref:hypothetical protein n=1 Tax=Clostridium sp. Cult1 TaxID=2079002 RepID=UPI001F1F0AF2|nr:hypothetical protein [Clostridium sp. Cult1]MCF6463915.1 hypothetical protein [Clostridium sp. Cult1]